MFKKLLLFFVFLCAMVSLYPQAIENPNYGLKSHETLNIQSVMLTSNSTALFMAIENRSLDGTFCADKNIFIILPDGTRLKIEETDGIPKCPDSYVFKNFGEKLFFSLTFPALPKGTQWFDLLEDCNEACFSFNSIILDAEMNRKIDHAYALIESKNPEEACKEFEELLDNISDKRCSLTGAIYLNLIQLNRKMGNEKKSAEWLEALRKSDNPLKDKYLESLKN